MKEDTGWKETETSWVDLKTGLTWDKDFKIDINHYEAKKWASEQGKRLPTREEFIKAEKNGIRKLENIVWKGHWFWSSSLVPGYSDVAYGFYGGYGFADGNVYRNFSDVSVAARAVSRAEPGVGVDPKLDPIAEQSSEAKKLIRQIRAKLTQLEKLL